MVHHVVIGCQISETSVSSITEKIFDGVGKGTEWASILWLVVTGIIIWMIHKRVPGIYLQSVDTIIKDSCSLEAHMDDSWKLIKSLGMEMYNKENGKNLTMYEIAP